MPKEKKLVWVAPFTGATFKYGFGTTVDAADGTVAGHNAVAAGTTGILYGVNAPKPGRVTIEKTSETVNTFYDIGNRSALKTAGHRCTSPRGRRGGETRFARAVYVTISGYKYAWYMRKKTYNAIQADLAGLGIQLATPDDKDLVWGANEEHKPPKASRTNQDGSVNIVFIDPSKSGSLPQGWVLKGSDGAGVKLD